MFLEFDDLLVMLLLGESFPPPDDDAIDGVADPDLWPLVRLCLVPSLILGDP